MRQELIIDLGFIGHGAEKLQSLYSGYSEEPNEHGYFLSFEDHSQLVVNKGVLVHTNCWDTEEEFKHDLFTKLLFLFVEDKPKDKHWLVKLTLHIGEYEKTAIHVVTASTEEQAMQNAIVAECHGDPDYEEYPDKLGCWDVGEFVYVPFYCRELSSQEYTILDSILSTHSAYL
jgi:hypothetical protein